MATTVVVASLAVSCVALSSDAGAEQYAPQTLDPEQQRSLDTRLSDLPLIVPAAVDGSSSAHIAKWFPHVELIAKPGTERIVGKADFFVPLLQRRNWLVFANARGVFTSDPIQEGNFGLGFRHIVPDLFFGQDSILGLYGFFDIRNSAYGNTFKQGTIGVELLTEMFEFRANGYIPQSKQYQIGNGVSGATLTGITLTSAGTLVERAMPGFDVEAGVRLPLGDDFSFGLNAGYFRFERASTRVEGPRVRTELVFDNAMGWRDAKFVVGGEVRDDKLRGTEGYGFLRLRLPLNSAPGGNNSRPRLRGIDREMTRFVYRDTDIVSPAVTVGAGAPIRDQASGETVEVFEVAASPVGTGDCTSGNACTVSQAFSGRAPSGMTPGPGDVLFAVNDAGTINDNVTLTADAQKVIGDPDGKGADVPLSDAPKSRLTLSSKTGRATLNGTLTLTSNNVVRGLDVDNTSGVAVSAPGDLGSSTLLSDMTIRGAGGGVHFGPQSSGTATFEESVSIIGGSGSGAPVVHVEGGSANAVLNGTLSQKTGTGELLRVEQGHSGTLITNGGSLTATTGQGISFDDADGTYRFGGDITLSGDGAGVDITNGSAGNFSFASVEIDNTATRVAIREVIRAGSRATGFEVNNSPDATTAIAKLIIRAGDAGVAARNGGLLTIGSPDSASLISGAVFALAAVDTDVRVENLTADSEPQTTDIYGFEVSEGQPDWEQWFAPSTGMTFVATKPGSDIRIASSSISGTYGLFAQTTLGADLSIDISDTRIDAARMGMTLGNRYRQGRVTVSGFSNVQVRSGSDQSGAVNFEGVVFDANPETAAIEPVTGASVSIGTPDDRQIGRGLRFREAGGAISFDRVDVHTNGQDALHVSNTVIPGSFELTVKDGSVSTLAEAGSAVWIDGSGAGNVILDMTLSDVALLGTIGSINGFYGLFLNDVSGSFTVKGPVRVESGVDAISIQNSSASFKFGDVYAENVLNGIYLMDNAGSFEFGNLNTGPSTAFGILMGRNTGDASFGNVTVDAPQFSGIDLFDNTGTVTFGNVNVTRPWLGPAIGIGDSGALSFGDVRIDTPNHIGALLFGDSALFGPVRFKSLNVAGDGRAGSMGISLMRVTGGQSIQIGQFTGAENLNDTPSRITGVERGIVIDGTSVARIIFGDGFASGDTASLIDVTNTPSSLAVDASAGLAPGTSLNLDDVQLGPGDNTNLD